MKIIIAGDGLYSKQPFIDELKQNRMSFILVAKPTDHTLCFASDGIGVFLKTC
jgi:hypothetical protein